MTDPLTRYCTTGQLFQLPDAQMWSVIPDTIPGSGILVYLASEVDALMQENERLAVAINTAMTILAPNMPESGLPDACRQVKQVAISEADNNERLEAALAASRQEVAELKTEFQQSFTLCAEHTPDRWEGDGTNLHAQLLASQAREAALRVILIDSAIILEGLYLSVEWELAPTIKAAIAKVVPQLRREVIAVTTDHQQLLTTWDEEIARLMGNSTELQKEVQK